MLKQSSDLVQLSQLFATIASCPVTPLCSWNLRAVLTPLFFLPTDPRVLPGEMAEQLPDVPLHVGPSTPEVEIHQLLDEVLLHEEAPGLGLEGQTSQQRDAVLHGCRGTAETLPSTTLWCETRCQRQGGKREELGGEEG